MGQGIWDRINGKKRKEKLDKMEQDALKPKAKKKPTKAKAKKSPEQSVKDSFWGG